MVSAREHDADNHLFVWEVAPAEPLTAPDPQWVTDVYDTARHVDEQTRDRRARLGSATRQLLGTTPTEEPTP